MDKSVRALSMAEDATAGMEMLRGYVKSKTRITVKSVHTDGQNRRVFGKIRSDGSAAVIVRFDGTANVKFGDQTLASGSTVCFAVLPAGENDVWISGTDNNAKVMVFGGSWL